MKEFKKYLAECLGTGVLVLLACGVAILTKGNIFVTALAFGLVIVAMAYSIGNISGCHINPAVSLAIFLTGRMKLKEFIGYVIAQCIGAIAAAEHIKAKLPLYYAEHLNVDFFAYIAEESGKPVGSAFLVLSEMPPNSNFPNGRIGTVLNVYVSPDYRRQGIASKLMSMLISDSKGMELDYIELKASSDGYLLYKKLGFEDSVSSFRPMKLRCDGK